MRPPNRSRRTIVKRAAAFFALALAALLLLSLPSLLGLRSQLGSARGSLAEARGALRRGDLDAATEALRGASTAFNEAVHHGAASALWLPKRLPLLGRSIRLASDLAAAGSAAVEAGLGMTRALERVGGGVSAFLPGGEAEPLRRVMSAMKRGRGLLRSALEKVESSPSGLVLTQLASAREEARAELRAATRGLAGAEELLLALPEMLGGRTARRYFVAAQNPAELRGTGGIIGAYSILTLDAGEFSFAPFRPVQTLPTYTPGEIAAPNPDYARNYDQFGGAGFWLNANMTPDFPSAATALLTSYEKATGQRLDGVIAADPIALRSLLEVTGGVVLPETGLEVDAGNVVALTANEAYGRFDDPAQRKELLGAVAAAAFARFLTVDTGFGKVVASLRSAVSGGHLLVFSRDPVAQRAVATVGLGGELPETGPGDMLAVIQNNAGGNKVDYYLRRSISYAIRLMPEGEGDASIDLGLANDAPRQGPPPYVIGPYPGVSGAGENVTLVTTFVDGTTRLVGAHLDGKRTALIPGRELGHRLYHRHLRIRSGEAMSLRYRVRVGEAWREEGGEGVYRLTIVTQPTIRPAPVRIAIVAPPGKTVRAASDPLSVSGPTATWRGLAPRRLDLWVRFS